MGYIKLDRAIRKWRWYTKKNMLNVWIELLLSAAFEDYYCDGQLVKRGQAIIGREKLAKQLGIGVQELRTCLNRLVSTGEITIQSTNRGSIVTIVKWDEYQSSPSITNQESNQRTNQQVTSNQPATNQPLTTIKEIKEDKEVKEIKETYRAEGRLRARACFDNAQEDDFYTMPLRSFYEREIGRSLEEDEGKFLDRWKQQYDDSLIRYAIIEASLYGKDSLQYIDRILNNWDQKGLTAERYENGER